ncbi:MAG: GNAT family N-acetyltransferase [Kouleothrix sp.]
MTPATGPAHPRRAARSAASSLVLWHADAPAGIAMLGLRGQQAWCGGFGITAPLRGQQLAGGLATAMIEQARLAGAQALRLEVLVRNTPALRVYLRAGFQPRRDLLVLQWRRAAGAAAPEPTSGPVVVERDPRSLLAHFDRLHARRRRPGSAICRRCW